MSPPLANDQQWVACSESKPSNGLGVLVWCPKSGCVFTAYWRNADECWYAFKVSGIATELGTEPSHWMLVPDAPLAALDVSEKTGG